MVNSHFHDDHVGGNGAFGDAAIAGTARMRELIAAGAPASRDEFEQMATETEQAAARMAAEAESEADRVTAAGLKELAEALIEDEDGHRVVLPEVLISDRLELVGERTAVVLSYGRGHTESDVFVHVPDAGVLVAGDLVWNGLHPKTNDGFPRDWADVVARISGLGVYTDYPLGRTAGPPHDPTRQREIVGGALELAAGMTTPGEMIDTPFRWSDDDSWKHNPMGSGGGSGGERRDTRNERVPTPQYQTPEDEALASARSYAEQCEVCIGLPAPG